MMNYSDFDDFLLIFQHSDDKDELIKNEEIDPATPQAIAKKKKFLGKINYKVRGLLINDVTQ